MSENVYTEQGRIINRKASDTEIMVYLGLESIVDNFDVVKEYIDFEEKYFNKDVEFCMYCDIESDFIRPTKILEKGKYLVVFE